LSEHVALAEHGLGLHPSGSDNMIHHAQNTSKPMHVSPFPLYPELHVQVAVVDGGARSTHVAFGWHGLAPTAHASKFSHVMPSPEYPD
jgi:hypothetical protein